MHTFIFYGFPWELKGKRLKIVQTKSVSSLSSLKNKSYWKKIRGAIKMRHGSDSIKISTFLEYITPETRNQ